MEEGAVPQPVLESKHGIGMNSVRMSNIFVKYNMLREGQDVNITHQP